MKKEKQDTEAAEKEVEDEFSLERLQNARRVFRDFLEIQPGEKVLFLTDNDPASTDRRLIDAFKKELENEGVGFSEFVVDNKKTTTKEVEGFLKDYKIVWSSCDWDANEIDFYEFAEKLKEMNARMSNSDGVTVDALDGGALSEDREAMERRLVKMEKRLQDVVGFHIRTSYGTDLKVGLRPPEERRWVKDDGVIKPGHWDNIPGGEIFTTPDEEDVNGVLVLPVLQEQVTKKQGVDEFVRLTVRGGKIAKIDGGKSAESLRKYLESASKSEKISESVLQCAEIAFGANEKARSRVSNPERSYFKSGISSMEAEKRLGTMHVAFGSSKHGEEGSEGHTESYVHLDFVLPRFGLTVIAYKSREKFKQGLAGEKLVDNGMWSFIE